MRVEGGGTVISQAQFRPEVVTLVCVPKTVSRGMRSSRDPCELRSCPLSRSTRATRSSSDSFFGAAEAADLLATRAPAPLSSALRDVRCDLVPRVRPVADVAAARSSSSCMWRRERLARGELGGGRKRTVTGIHSARSGQKRPKRPKVFCR